MTLQEAEKLCDILCVALYPTKHQDIDEVTYRDTVNSLNESYRDFEWTLVKLVHPDMGTIEFDIEVKSR